MSAQHRSSRWLVFSISALVVGLMVCLTPAIVLAQGGRVPESSGCSYLPPSSCSTCHAQVDPVANLGEWHIVHARNDICRNCHGGDDRTMDKDQAHFGMMSNPLDDTDLSCHQCHPDDYPQRADQFASMLGVTPQSSQPVSMTLAGAPPSNQVPIIRSSGSLPTNTPPDRSLGLWMLAAMVGASLAGLMIMWRKLAH